MVTVLLGSGDDNILPFASVQKVRPAILVGSFTIQTLTVLSSYVSLLTSNEALTVMTTLFQFHVEILQGGSQVLSSACTYS